MSQPPTVEEVEQKIPRQYQTEIFEHAQNSNIIAVMDTGTGKTLIAITLIKWITTRLNSTPGEPRKVVVFIVPKVPLVEQQRDAISEQTSLIVRGYYGALDVDYWKREQWAKEFNEADVLVMTPRVLYDLLSHAHWSIDRISLLIFDEAHHCRKNNDYNQIMRDHYYKCDPSRRPKVFGMTASPIWNPKNALESLRELERNMNARVLAVRANVEELHKHAPKPKETVLYYEATPTFWPDYINRSMYGELVQAEGLGVRDAQRKTFRTRYEATMDCLGIVGAEYFLCTVIPQEIASLVREKRREVTTIHKLLAPGENPALEAANINMQIAHLERIKGVLVEQSASLSAQSLDIPPEWLAPRMVELAKLLHQFYAIDPACQCIIFVEQRQVAMVLCWILRHISYLRSMIRPTFVTGHGDATHRSKREEEDIHGMSVKEQQGAIRAFREGRANVMVATSVAEEGLDFQPCNLVVRFDALHTMVSYAQSRGRARQKASTYVIMLPHGESEAADRYMRFTSAEPGLKATYQKRASSGADMETEEAENISESDLRLREVHTTATGAILTYGNAIALLSRLCAVHPIEPGLPVLRPTYALVGGQYLNADFGALDNEQNFGFSYALTLPSALPLPREQLHRNGPFRLSKKEAKRAVAFESTRALHELGCFDDYLLPIQENNDREGVDADGEQFKPLNLSDVFEDAVLHVWGDPWSSDHQLFCYPLKYGDRITVGLITCAKLSLDDVNDSIGLTPRPPQVAQPVVLTFSSQEERAERMQVMKDYTTFAIQWTMSRRPFEGELACFLVKLRENGLPDYAAMNQAMKFPLSVDWRRDWTEDSRIIVMQKTTWLRVYRLLAVKKDITPSTPLRTIDRKCCESECATYLEHYARIDAAVQEKKSQKALQHDKPVVRKSSTFPPLSPDEPMVVLIPVRNADTDHADYLVPSSFIKRISLEDEMFRVTEALPSLLRHITSVVRARALQSHLRLPKYPISRFVEALATPGALPKYNYNRLEFLGDSFLKLATSIHIFNKYPYRHEGQLAALREGSVRNSYLRGKAYRLGIHYYTVNDKIGSLKRWLPPVTANISIKDGITLIKQDILRRWLSDCVESVLGASYLCGGLNGFLRAGTEMGLCFGGMEPWTARYPSAQPFFEASTSLKTLQVKLGYEFRNPLLLLEALTHPTFPDSQTPSYQRLEFLGDALIDIFVGDHIFTRFPAATAHKLSWMHHLLVCNPLLGAVAIRELGLQKHILHMAPRLDREIAVAVKQLNEFPYSELAAKWWEYDPPKALNDVLEAILGALLVDSNYDIDVCNPVLSRLFKDTLPLGHPDIPLHPVMELYIWSSRHGCRGIHFEKSCQREESTTNDTSHVFVHDIEISRSTRDSLSVAKCFAAYEARAILSDPANDKALIKLCNCAELRAEAAQRRQEEKLRKEQGKLKVLDTPQIDQETSYLAMDVDGEGAVKAGRVIGFVDAAEVEQVVAAILDDPMDAANAAAMGSSKDETNEGFAEIGRMLMHAAEETPINNKSDDEDDAADMDIDEEPGEHEWAADAQDAMVDDQPVPSASIQGPL
ncbi:P-loop containing nucleoside triphosphate hydrolase protein [Calocera viscosa TUFC12733]|uniref:p-loop containing nucleoside triphosphate hydrolase protein n=1 Tax=Calocera viscosa (strain TUFC12733) TaxID=1330018 RepID=A0A167L280_CALVF|nr:P-loop containing nucleoside triphosphate hydrolase protein [Calocera viscosa TUFC12733]